MNKSLAELNGICLINALDVISRLYADSDKEIDDRYGTEKDGLEVALKYIELAERANRVFLIAPLPTSIKISQPDKNGNRIEKNYTFLERENQHE